MKILICGIYAGLLAAMIYPQSGVVAEELGKRYPGLWVKEPTFLQVNIGCLQVWQCTHKEDVLHGADTSVRSTPPEKTAGVCNAGGSVDSCNLCAASAPKGPCEWWLEKK